MNTLNHHVTESVTGDRADDYVSAQVSEQSKPLWTGRKALQFVVVFVVMAGAAGTLWWHTGARDTPNWVYRVTIAITILFVATAAGLGVAFNPRTNAADGSLRARVIRWCERFIVTIQFIGAWFAGLIASYLDEISNGRDLDGQFWNVLISVFVLFGISWLAVRVRNDYRTLDEQIAAKATAAQFDRQDAAIKALDDEIAQLRGQLALLSTSIPDVVHPPAVDLPARRTWWRRILGS